MVLKTLFTTWQIKETLFIHLCNEYVLCLERFDEREQSITRNVIWIVIKKKKKKMIKVTGIKRGKKKETGIENNLLARNMIIRKNYKLDVSICDFYPLGRSIKKSNASFR